MRKIAFALALCFARALYSQHVSVATFGGMGDDATDNTVALQACVNASEGSRSSVTCYIPNGVYKTGTVKITKPMKLECQSSQAVLKINSVDTATNTAIKITSAPAFGPAISFTGDIAQGATTLKLPSVTGLAVGQDVVLQLGNSSTDATAPQITMFDYIVGIVGNTVSLQTPIPEVISGGIAAKPSSLTTVAQIAENVEISGCGFDVVAANEGHAQADISVEFARNVHLHDLVGYRVVEALAIVGESENVAIDNVYIRYAPMAWLEAGRGITSWQSSNITVKNLWCVCESEIINLETGIRGFHAEDVHDSIPVGSKGPTPIEVVSDDYNVTLDRVQINSAIPIVEYSGFYRDVVLQGPVGVFPLPQLTGSLTYKGIFYPETRTDTFSVPLIVNTGSVGQTFSIPNGYYKSVRVYASATSGITYLYFLSPGGGGAEFSASLVARKTVDMAKTPNGQFLTYVGTGYSFTRDTTVHFGSVTTDGTLPPNSYLTFEITYYPDPAYTFTNSGRVI